MKGEGGMGEAVDDGGRLFLDGSETGCVCGRACVRWIDELKKYMKRRAQVFASKHFRAIFRASES